MFWSKKKQTKKSDNDGKSGGKNKGGQSTEALKAEAMANMKAARQQIGEETLDRIAAAMTKMQSSNVQKARAEINNADPDRVLDELKWMLDNRD